MKKIFLLIITMFYLQSCCSFCEKSVIVKYRVPEITCPEIYSPEFEKLTIEKTPEENTQIDVTNREKAIKLIKQLKIKLKCIEESLKKFKELSEDE